ncbi:MAG: T9SS C-terminal target domain-containing protein [Bacteroidetes bacterium]|nr:MAG: T9SS C-terminal target domain-containing protein [Bacteroidota bacterium]
MDNFLFRYFALLSFLTIFSLRVQAQTWTGATNTDWNTTSNWSPASVPNSATADVVIPNGLTNYPVLATNIEVRNLTFDDNGGGTLTSATLTLGAFNLTIRQNLNVKYYNSSASPRQIGTNTAHIGRLIILPNATNTSFGTNAIGTSKIVFNAPCEFTLNSGNSRFESLVFNNTVTFNYSTTALSNCLTGGNTYNENATFNFTGSNFSGIGYTALPDTWFAGGRETFTKNLTITTSGNNVNLWANVGGNLSVTVSASGEFSMSNVSVAGTTTFLASTITSNNGIRIGQNTGEVVTFGGDVSITNTNSTVDNIFRCANLGNVTFNGNVTIASSGGNAGGISIGDDANSAGTLTLAADKTITTGAFSRGILRIQKIRQTSGTNTQTHNITLSNAISNNPNIATEAEIILQNNVFQANMTVQGAVSRLSRNTFGSGASNTFSLTIPSTNTGNDNSTYGGKNIFKAATTITNQSSAFIYLGVNYPWLDGGNSGGDIFEADATFNVSESTTPNPPPVIFTSYATSYATVSNAAAATSTYATIIDKRNAVKAAIALMNTNANTAKTNADNTKVQADLMVASDATCTGVKTNAGTNQTTANSNQTTANNLRTSNSDTSIDGYTDAQLNTLISSINSVNTQTGTINSTMNGHSNSINTCNTTDRNTKRVSGAIFMSDGAFTNQYLGNVTINTSNRGRFFMGENTAGSITTIAGTTTINNTSYGGSNGSIRFANSGNITFNGNVNVNSNVTAIPAPGSDLQAHITFGNTGNCNFNGNIVMQKTGTHSSDYNFGSNNTSTQGTQTLAVGKTITIGAGGFNNGNLNFNGFKQLSTATPHTFLIESQVRINIGRNTVFNSDITFNNTSQRTDFPSNGLDIAPDLNDIDVIFNGNVIVRNQAGSTTSIDFTRRNGKAYLNGNITIESAVDKMIGFFSDGSWGSTTTPKGETTLASGKTITVTPTGFTAGTLFMGNFKQLGTTAQNISTIGTNCVGNLLTSLFITDNSVWNGNLTVSVPNLTLANSTYKGTFEVVNCNQLGWPYAGTSGGNVFEKTVIFTYRGANEWVFGGLTGDTYMDGVTFNNENNGWIAVADGPSNIFQKTVTFDNNRAFVGIEPRRGAIRIANNIGNSATFQGIVTVHNQGSGAAPGTFNKWGEAMRFAENGTVNFEKDIIFNSYSAHANTIATATTSTGDVRFANWNPASHNGTTNLSSGAKILINTWQAGSMHMRGVVQAGTSTPQSITLPLISNGTLSLGDRCVWNSNFFGSARQINLSGATYNGTSTFEMLGNSFDTQTGATNPFDGSIGNNTFNNTTLIRHRGSNTGNSTWNLNVVNGDDVNNNITYDILYANNNIRILRGTTRYAGNVNIISTRNNDFEFGDNTSGTGVFRFDGTGTQNITTIFSHPSASNKILNFRSVEMQQSNASSKVLLQRNTAMRNIAFTTGKIDFGSVNLSLGNVNVDAGATFIDDVGTFSGANANSYVLATSSGTARRRVPNGNTNIFFPVGNDAYYLPINIAQNGTTDVFNLNTLNGVFPTYSASNVPSGTAYSGGFANGVWRVREETAGGTTNFIATTGWDVNAEMSSFDRNKSLPLRYNFTTNKWRCLNTPSAATGSSPVFARVASEAQTSTEIPTNGALFAAYGLIANAGSDQTHCIPTIALTMNATALPTGFTGTWSKTSGAGSPTFSNVNNPVAAVTSLTASTTYVFRWTINNNFEGTCSTAGFDEVQIQVLNAGGSTPTLSVWTGAATSPNQNDWFNCQNWNTGVVPTASIDAEIPNVTNYPVLPNTASAVCKNLSLTTSSATLTIQSGALLDIKGDVTNAGTISNAGTLIANGNLINTLALNNTNLLKLYGNLTNNGNNINYTSGTIEFLGNSSSIAGTGQVRLFNAIVNKTASQTITLSRQVEINANGLLTLTQGIMHTSSTNLLIINDNANSTEGNANSYINGTMRKIGNDAFVFPVGKGGRWARIAVSDFTLTSTTDFFQAEYFATSHGTYWTVNAPLRHSSEVEYWILDRGNTGGGSGSTEPKVTLYWQSGSQSGINEFTNDLRVAHWNGTKWDDKGSVLSGSTASGNITTPTRQSTFSPWTFGSLDIGIGNPLPTKLASFVAQRTNQTKVKLDWQTVNEKDNIGFYVEKSEDAINFESIGFLDGAGTSAIPKNYQLIDNQEKSVYYRLKQINLNNTFEYSEIRFVKGIDLQAFKVYPNPTKSNVTIEIPCSDNENIYYNLYNNLGVRLEDGVSNKQKISAVVSQHIEKIPQGMYIIEFIVQQGKYQSKIIKL